MPLKPVPLKPIRTAVFFLGSRSAFSPPSRTGPQLLPDSRAAASCSLRSLPLPW